MSTVIRIPEMTLKYRLLPIMLLLTGVLTLASLRFGAVPVSLDELAKVLLGQEQGQLTTIILALRLPRALLALGVGALLATSGAVAQGLFRNPLADPSLIGIGAGAAAGASIVIFIVGEPSGSIMGLSLVSIGAFVGGLLTVGFIYRFAATPSGISVAVMLLLGIAISFFVGSLVGVLEFFGDNEALRRLSLWRMGGLESANFYQVLLAFGVAFVIFCLLPRHFAALDALLLGESEARHLGIRLPAVKLQLILMIAVAVATAVAMAGMVAFVGLIIPHLMRLLFGPKHSVLIPLSCLAGGLLLLLADTLARTVIAPIEMPVGLITALIGAPIFVSLLRHRQQYGMH